MEQFEMESAIVQKGRVYSDQEVENFEKCIELHDTDECLQETKRLFIKMRKEAIKNGETKVFRVQNGVLKQAMQNIYDSVEEEISQEDKKT